MCRYVDIVMAASPSVLKLVSIITHYRAIQIESKSDYPVSHDYFYYPPSTHRSCNLYRTQT